MPRLSAWRFALKTLALFLLLAAGCATTSGSAAGAATPTAAAVQRIETPAGAFLVRQAVAEDFKHLLAGEPTAHPYYAGDTQ